MTQRVRYVTMLSFAAGLSALLAFSASSDMTVGHFTIDSSCLRHTSDSGEDWSHFPGNANAFVRAANSVTARMKPCLQGINPDVADDLSSFLAHSGKVRVLCRPDAGSSAIECAHVTRGISEIILTRPNDCGALDNTLFHELLHLGSGLDGMTAAHHNTPACRPYDAIYASAEICFPSTLELRDSGIGWFGCKAAVTNASASDRICGRLPVVVDANFQTCAPRGYR